MKLSESDIQQLRDIPLFQGFEEADYTYLFNNVLIKDFPPHYKIINKGDTANAMYVIVSGALEVYIDKPAGDRVILAIIGTGELVGEDGLNPGSNGVRTADVQTIEDTRVIEISAEVLSHLIPKYEHVTEQLALRSTVHSYDRMFKLSSSLQNTKITPEENKYIKERYFKKDDVIFSMGDDGDAAFLIVSGKVRVTKPEGHSLKTLGYLSQGQYFGEIAILENSKRSASVIAEEDTTLLSIDKELFVKWHSTNALFRQLMHSLKNVYRMQDESLITTHTGEYEGKDCISTIRRKANGDTFCSIKMLDEETSIFYKLGMSEDQNIRRISYSSMEKDRKRELHIADNKLVGVMSSGPNWLNLGEIITAVIEGKQLANWQIEMFQQRGEIKLENANDLVNNDSIVCNCVKLSYGKLCDAINVAGHNEDKIINMTGATLTCGSCKPVIDELFGKTNYIDLRVKSVTEINENIFSIVLESLNEKLPPFMPGQFINLQVQFEGKWLQRSYSIAGLLSERAWEIVVQRQMYGLMSTWLTGSNQDQTIVRASPPHGTFTVGSTLTRTIFFAAGIGVTPALSMLRAKIPGFHLFYSEPTDKDFIYKDELKKYDNVEFYSSRVSGHLSPLKIKKIMQDFKDAMIMICGPKGFTKNIYNTLLSLNIPKEKIKIESFIIEDIKLQQQESKDHSRTLRPVLYTNEHDEVERFLDSIYAEYNLLNVYHTRLTQIREEIKSTGTFKPSPDEINNVIKKILSKTNINLSNLYILDRRAIVLQEEAYKILADHNYYVANNSNNIVITIIDSNIEITTKKNINIDLTKYCRLKAIVDTPKTIAIDHLEYKFEKVNWLTPPNAREGKQKIPFIGAIYFLKDFLSNPMRILLKSRKKWGDIFSFRIPLALNLVYVGKDSYNTLLEMPKNIAGLGGVLMMLPAVGLWYRRSRNRDESWLQELISVSRQFIADELTSVENLKDMKQIVDEQVDQHTQHWGQQVDLAVDYVKVLYEAGFSSIMRDRFPPEVKEKMLPLFRDIANGIDVPRASLAQTPFYKQMPEYVATRKLEKYLDELIEEHRQTNKYPFIDVIAALQVEGKPIPASDVSWVLMYILWNVFTYTGTYGTWALIDMLKSENVISDLNKLQGEERKNFLYACYIETIRSKPPASLVRKNACPITYQANQKTYVIKKNTLIGVMPPDACYDAQNYKDPYEYNPYRYMQGEKFPDLFGRGPFSCPAVQFTRNIITMTADATLQKFDLKLIPPTPEGLCRAHLIYPSGAVMASCTLKKPI